MQGSYIGRISNQDKMIARDCRSGRHARTKLRVRIPGVVGQTAIPISLTPIIQALMHEEKCLSWLHSVRRA